MANFLAILFGTSNTVPARVRSRSPFCQALDIVYLGVDESKSKLVEEEGAQAVAGKDHRQNHQDGEVPPVNVIISNKAIFKFCHTAVFLHSPDDEVDLLIDDVLREDAEPVVVLLPAGRPDVGNRAGHLGREDRAHRVDLVIRV